MVSKHRGASSRLVEAQRARLFHVIGGGRGLLAPVVGGNPRRTGHSHLCIEH
jgi:hypothetical protein